MECTVHWLSQDQGMSFVARTGSGHLISMDGAQEAGGHNLAPRPMEVVLAGTGGCAAFDVVMILQRARQAVTQCSVVVKGERAPTDPKVFVKVVLHFIITGKDLAPHQVERAVHLSAEKYCSATAMLGKTATIEHTWEIVAS